CRRNAPRRTAAVPTTESPAPPGSESTPRPPRRSPRRSPPPPPAGHDLQTSLQVLRFTNDKGPVGSAAGPVSDRGYLSGIRLQNRLITGPITGSQVKCTIFRSLASINRLTANSRLRCYGFEAALLRTRMWRWPEPGDSTQVRSRGRRRVGSFSGSYSGSFSTRLLTR